MKKLLSLALALAIAATSVVSASAAASGDKIEFKYGSSKSDYVTEYAVNVESDALTAKIEGASSDVKAYFVNGRLGGSGNVSVDEDGNVTVVKNAPVGEYVITGASSAKADEAEPNTNEIILNVVDTEKLTKIAEKANTVKDSTVYEKEDMKDFKAYLEDLADPSYGEGVYFSYDGSVFATTKKVPVNATQDDINDLVVDLTDRYDELVSVSGVNSDLKNLFDAVESVNELHDSRLSYSQEAWDTFVTKLGGLLTDYPQYLDQTLPTEYVGSTYDVDDMPAASFAMLATMDSNDILKEDDIKKLVEEIEDAVAALTKSSNRVGYEGDVNALIKSLNAVAKKDQPADFETKLNNAQAASNSYVIYVGKYGNQIRVATKVAPTITTKDVKAALDILMDLNESIIYAGEPTAQDLADFDAAIDAVNAISADKVSYDRTTYNTFAEAIRTVAKNYNDFLTYSSSSATMLTKKPYAGVEADRKDIKDMTKALEAAIEDINGAMDAYVDYLEFVNGMDQADYTSKSWSRFTTELTKALSTYASTLEGSLGSIAIRTDLNTSRGNVTRAMDAVIDAVDLLVSNDYNEDGYDEYAVDNAALKLNAAIKNKALYDDDSFADFIAALGSDEKLYKVINVNDSTNEVTVDVKTEAFAQSGLDAYADRLVSMIDLLEAKDGSIAALVAEVNAVIENKVAYTADSFDAFYAYVKAMGTNSSVLKVEEDGTLTVKNLKNVDPTIVDSTADSLKVAMEKLVAVSGWVKAEDGTWSFVKDGAKMTGWVSVAGEWYYMDAEGVMVTGWAKVDGTWYYLTGNGSMAIGWVKDGGNWYLMSNSGAMCTGWAFSGGRWFFLNADGSMKANAWISYNNNWYYVNNDGACSAAKWQWIGGKCYYFFSDAKMAANTSVDGYKLGADGAWVK